MRAYVRSPVTLTRDNGEKAYYLQGWCEIAQEDEKNPYLMAFFEKIEMPIAPQSLTSPLADNPPPPGANNPDEGDGNQKGGKKK